MGCGEAVGKRSETRIAEVGTVSLEEGQLEKVLELRRQSVSRSQQVCLGAEGEKEERMQMKGAA